jgi:hypothetical protein
MTRLEILKNSLAKKQAAFDAAFTEHTDDVKSANGQPLNDKRNGAATFKRWEKQEGKLRRLQAEIKKTEAAIEREEAKQYKVDHESQFIPQCVLDLVAKGELNQWRKYPNRFFVPGVDKARLIWDNKAKVMRYSHVQGMPEEQRPIFIEMCKRLATMLKEEV